MAELGIGSRPIRSPRRVTQVSQGSRVHVYRRLLGELAAQLHLRAARLLELFEQACQFAMALGGLLDHQQPVNFPDVAAVAGGRPGVGRDIGLEHVEEGFGFLVSVLFAAAASPRATAEYPAGAADVSISRLVAIDIRDLEIGQRVQQVAGVVDLDVRPAFIFRFLLRRHASPEIILGSLQRNCPRWWIPGSSRI